MTTYIQTPTEEIYNRLMRRLEDLGYEWWNKENPTKKNYWDYYREDTVIYIRDNKTILYDKFSFAKINNIKLNKEIGGFMYKEGDILVNHTGYEKKVLGVCGEVYLMSRADEFDESGSCYTEKELLDKGYKLKEETDEVEEAIKLLEKKGKLIDGKIVKQ